MEEIDAQPDGITVISTSQDSGEEGSAEEIWTPPPDPPGTPVDSVVEELDSIEPVENSDVDQGDNNACLAFQPSSDACDQQAGQNDGTAVSSIGSHSVVKDTLSKRKALLSGAIVPSSPRRVVKVVDEKNTNKPSKPETRQTQSGQQALSTKSSGSGSVDENSLVSSLGAHSVVSQHRQKAKKVTITTTPSSLSSLEGNSVVSDSRRMWQARANDPATANSRPLRKYGEAVMVVESGSKGGDTTGSLRTGLSPYSEELDDDSVVCFCLDNGPRCIRCLTCLAVLLFLSSAALIITYFIKSSQLLSAEQRSNNNLKSVLEDLNKILSLAPSLAPSPVHSMSPSMRPLLSTPESPAKPTIPPAESPSTGFVRSQNPAGPSFRRTRHPTSQPVRQPTSRPTLTQAHVKDPMDDVENRSTPYPTVVPTASPTLGFEILFPEEEEEFLLPQPETSPVESNVPSWLPTAAPTAAPVVEITSEPRRRMKVMKPKKTMEPKDRRRRRRLGLKDSTL